jgi:hypothetical protein
MAFSKQTWPSSLTDTRPRIERLQNPTHHHWGMTRDRPSEIFPQRFPILSSLPSVSRGSVAFVVHSIAKELNPS